MPSPTGRQVVHHVTKDVDWGVRVGHEGESVTLGTVSRDVTINQKFPLKFHV